MYTARRVCRVQWQYSALIFHASLFNLSVGATRHNPGENTNNMDQLGSIIISKDSGGSASLAKRTRLIQDILAARFWRPQSYWTILLGACRDGSMQVLARKQLLEIVEANQLSRRRFQSGRQLNWTKDATREGPFTRHVQYYCIRPRVHTTTMQTYVVISTLEPELVPDPQKWNMRLSFSYDRSLVTVTVLQQSRLIS